MNMKDIMEHDKGKERADGGFTSAETNPKKAIKDIIEASKQRKARAINDDEALFAESTLKKSARSRSSVKTTTTLKLGKEKAEITTTA